MCLDYLVLAEQSSLWLTCADSQGLPVVFVFKSPSLTWLCKAVSSLAQRLFVLLVVSIDNVGELSQLSLWPSADHELHDTTTILFQCKTITTRVEHICNPALRK